MQNPNFLDYEIDALELRECLRFSGRYRFLASGEYYPFSLETCITMVNFLDKDNSGKIGFPEFKRLFECLDKWEVIIGNQPSNFIS